MSDVDWQTPPARISKRRNAAVRYYDLPLYTDWAAWSTVLWTLIGGLSVGFNDQKDPSASTMSDWIGVPFSALLLGFIFGLVPAMLRLGYRRLRAKRMATPPASGASVGSPPALSKAIPEEPSPHLMGAPQLAGRTFGVTGAPVSPKPDDDSKHDPEAAPIETSEASSSTAKASQRTHRSMAAPIAGTTDLDSFAASQCLMDARQALYYPIARAVRAVQLGADRRIQYEAMLDVGEALSVALGASVTAWLRSRGVAVTSLQKVHDAFLRGGVSQGSWLSVLQETYSSKLGNFDAVPGFEEAIKRGRGGGGLLADLELLVGERNRWAHGARPRNEIDAALRVQEIGPVMARALDRALPLSQSPWLLTQSISYQRHGHFSISALRAMGDHPDFERISFESSVPLLDNTLYLATTNGLVSLAPLVVMHYCDTCRRPELCYADRVNDRQQLVLKSFATGHVLFDGALSLDLESLFSASSTNPPV